MNIPLSDIRQAGKEVLGTLLCVPGLKRAVEGEGVNWITAVKEGVPEEIVARALPDVCKRALEIMKERENGRQ